MSQATYLDAKFSLNLELNSNEVKLKWMKLNIQYKGTRKSSVALLFNSTLARFKWLANVLTCFRKRIGESVMEKPAEETVVKKTDTAVKGEAAIKPQ